MRRITQLPEVVSWRSPSPMYLALENQILQAFAQSEHDLACHYQQVYVAKRARAANPVQLRILIEKMPADIKALIDSQSSDNPLLDEVELDLLDLLFHFDIHRMVFVLGEVGVGKSTFLRHVLFSIRSCSKSLQTFFPLFINCAELPSNVFSNSDIILACAHGIDNNFKFLPDIQRDASISDIIYNAITRFSQDRGNIGSPSLSAFVKTLRQALGGAFQPVVVFDNCDICEPSVVAQVCDLARALFLQTGCFVIVTMRPPTYRTHFELWSDKGSYHRLVITIDTPDLRTVIQKRLDHVADQFVRTEFSTQIGRVILSDPYKSLSSISKNILLGVKQQSIIQGICGDSVRRGLHAFYYFLRYKHLTLGRTITILDDTESDAVRWRGWVRQLFDGLMIGDKMYYDSSSSPIVNILFFSDHEFGTSYVILFRILSILSAHRKILNTKRLQNILILFGHPAPRIEHALEFLLGKGLVRSPESYENIASADHIEITSIGTYYIDTLICRPQYLWNAIYDVELDHMAWIGESEDNFSVRSSSISELITLVISQERTEIAYISESIDHLAVAAIVDGALMSRLLLRSAERIATDASFSRYEKTHDAGNAFHASLALHEKDCAALEATLQDVTQRPSEELQDTTFSQCGGPENRVTLRAGRRLVACRPNQVEVDCDLTGLEDGDPVFVCLRSGGELLRIDECAVTERLPGRPVYRAVIDLPFISNSVDRPDYHITVMTGANPVMIAAFHQ